MPPDPKMRSPRLGGNRGHGQGRKSNSNNPKIHHKVTEEQFGDAESRALELYEGRNRIGAMIARCGVVDAFDVHGLHLGTFKNIKSASSAINASLSGSCVGDTNARRDNG